MAGLYTQDVIVELAQRRGEYIPVVATQAGGYTTILADVLADYFVEDVEGLNAWVYYPSTGLATPANSAQSRRARRFKLASNTLEFYRAWPAMPIVSTDIYHLTTRTPWHRLHQAVKSGVAAISLPFAMPVSQSFPIVANQYRYTLTPNGQTFIDADLVDDILVSVNTGGITIDYPYASAGPYNWKIYKTGTAAGDGTVTLGLQFEVLPAAGSTIRLYGRQGVEMPLLGLDDSWIQLTRRRDEVLEYLMLHASYVLSRWDVDSEPVGKAEYAMRVSLQTLEAARAQLMDILPRPEPARIVVPGRGSARTVISADHDGDWLGATHGAH